MGRLPERPSHDIVPREEDCSEAPVQAPFCLCPSACLRVGEHAPEVLSRGSETTVEGHLQMGLGAEGHRRTGQQEHPPS